MSVLAATRLLEQARPDPAALLDALEPIFPLIGLLDSTPQDPEWHAEGNVRIHTEMVIAETLRLLESEGDAFSPQDRTVLLLGAALHDVGKALTTGEASIDGQIRVISPHHAERGASHVAPRLAALGLDDATARAVIGLVAFHHHPTKLVSREAPSSQYARLAREVDPRLIYWLEKADLRGRHTAESHRSRAVEMLELFRIECEATGNWGGVPRLYETWSHRLEGEFGIASPLERGYVWHWAIADYESGRISSLEEALARTHPHRSRHAVLIVTCGPSGSGKSSWCARQPGDWVRISLDDLRCSIAGKRSDQSRNGEVIQEAKRLLRIALRDKQTIIWDATSLRRDGRSVVLGLGTDYHALTRIQVFATPPEPLYRRDRERADSVGKAIIDRQFESWQWPGASEAHEIGIDWGSGA